MKIKLLFFIICVTTFNFAGAQTKQPGFIITNELDTLYGMVNIFDYDDVTMTFTQGADKKKYYASELAGWGITNGSFFTSRLFIGYFAEVLISGNISIYKYQGQIYIQKEGYEYVQVVNTRKSLITRWEGVFRYWISDCIVNYKTIKLQSDINSLTELVKEYNICKNSDYVEYQKDVPWRKAEYSIFGGISTTKMSLFNNEDSGVANYITQSFFAQSPMAGIGISLTSPRISNRLAIDLDFYIRFFRFYSKLDTDLPDNKVFNEFFQKNHLRSLKLGVRYTLYPFQLPVNLHTGFTWTMNSSDLSLFSEIDDLKGVVVTEKHLDNSADGSIHPYFGIGTWFKAGTFKIGADIYYERDTPIFKFVHTKSNYLTLRISLTK